MKTRKKLGASDEAMKVLDWQLLFFDLKGISVADEDIDRPQFFIFYVLQLCPYQYEQFSLFLWSKYTLD